MAAFNPQGKAAEYALNLYEGLKKLSQSTELEVSDDGRLKAPGLRSRARSFPPLILSSGLLAAMAFALSKIDDLNALDAAYKLLAGRLEDVRVKPLVEDVKSEGYAVMAALVARILNDMGHCSLEGRVAIPLAKCLLELEERGGGILVAERIVMEVIYEFKKYVEALITD